MAENNRNLVDDGEVPAQGALYPVTGEEEGVDGEIDEMDDVSNVGETHTNKDMNGKFTKDSRKYISSDRRRHHHHHNSSSHRDRRRRTGGPGHIGYEQSVIDEDSHIDSGRSKRRAGSFAESHINPSDKNFRLSRKQDRSHGNHSHAYPRQQWPKQSLEDSSDNGEWSESHEDPLAHRKDNASTPRRMKGSLHSPVGDQKEGEAEDGEILEEGELSDDEVFARKDREEVYRDNTEVPPSKLSGKEDNKGEKHGRKKFGHKERRKRESDDKKKKKKYTAIDKTEDDNNTAPAWGSGYQGPKPLAPQFLSKQAHFGKGSKGYHSPPGLYDSPSYSEGSDEEEMPKAFMTEGYIDASVAADEKEGIFKISLAKKKKLAYDRSDRKRGRILEGKHEGPPRKKPLVDAAKSERPVCKFYMEGKCAKGSACPFNHDVEKPRKMEVCKYHLTVKGCIKQRCQYMHEDFPCKYYHTGAKCYSGDRCKFSHDPLTEATRRALEMRVAAEDIIDVDDPDYEYEYRPRETHSRPSLLGSPPRFRQDVKKIPSLFEIEVHPPGQSPKASPQTVRPSGFYSESTVSPKSNSNNSVNGPNVGIKSNGGALNQQGLSNQGSMGGPGLLQTPLRPGNIIGGPIVNNRPTLIMNIQQGMNTQQQRPGGAPPIQFIGPGQINSNQQGGNLPPVLNMLGAIIREAAMQKGPGIQNNSMNIGPSSGVGPSNILQNMKNLGPGINNVGPNNMQQGNINIGPNSIVQNSVGNAMLPSNIGNMQPNITNNIGSLQNLMGPNSGVGPNSVTGSTCPGNIGPSKTGASASMSSIVGSNKLIGIGQEVGIMDVDYRIKPEFEEIEETNQDLNELDKIRQQIQAQIDKEDEEGLGEDNSTANINSVKEEGEMQIPEELQEPVKTDGQLKKEDCVGNKAEMATEVDLMEIPADLPKKQRELFKRIQQQQLLREKERKRQEALKAAEETEVKAEEDDWYSSDEDGDDEEKPKLTDILKKLNQKPSVSPSGTLSSPSGTCLVGSSNASAMSIIQMINAIKNQSSTATRPPTDTAEESQQQASSSFSASVNYSGEKETILPLSPASPLQFSTKNISTPHSSVSTPRLSALTVDPPVVSAHPIKSLVYTVVKISLSIQKPYTQLPDDINLSDPIFKDDPRVKWHLHYLEKHMQKDPQRRDSSEGERPQKQPDPRLKQIPSDPRLARTGDSPNSGRGDGRISDPRLQRVQAHSRQTDPRLARQVGGNSDPRMSRQNSQNSPGGILMGGPMISVGSGPMNNMMGLIGSQMGGSVSSMGGIMNQMTGPVGAFVNSSMMSGFLNNTGQMASMANSVGGISNNPIRGSLSQMGGPGRSLQSSSDLVGSNINFLSGSIGNIGGPMNQIGSNNQLGPGPNPMGMMEGLQGTRNSVTGGQMSNNLRGPLNQQNLMSNDSTMLDTRVNSLLSPMHGNKRAPNDPRTASDPRLKSRLFDPRDQRINVKDPRLGGRDLHSVIISSSSEEGLNDPRTLHTNSDYKSFQSGVEEQGDFQESPSFFQSDTSFSSSGHLKASQTKEDVALNHEHRVESEFASTDEKPRKFDHRNDPRFKRVKRLAGPLKGNIEYNASLGGQDVQGDSDDGEDLGYSGYNRQKLTGQDLHSRNVPSPKLPDTLEDFDLPDSSVLTVQEPEPNLKVKDHFKTIDPTASPFC